MWLVQLRQMLTSHIVFVVRFSSTSLPTVDATVKVDIKEDDRKVICLSVSMAGMHIYDMQAGAVP